MANKAAWQSVPQVVHGPCPNKRVSCCYRAGYQDSLAPPDAGASGATGTGCSASNRR
jgi:hypothetical protein